MTHRLSGRKQSPEHIRKRVDAVAKAKEDWTEERHQLFVDRSREAVLSRDPEWKKKASESHLGQVAWNKGEKCPQSSGTKHWNWGGKMPQESIEKMRRSLTGKKQTPDHVVKRVEGRDGYTHSYETRKKISETHRMLFATGKRERLSGEKSPTWRGGFTPYPSTWTNELREMIRNRDGRKCCLCGKGENRIRHDVHHADYNKANLDPANLITLCISCHRKTNGRREEWTSFFTVSEQAVAM